MAKVYASLVIKGIKKFKEVPNSIKEKVKEILIEEGRGDLITEGDD